MCPDSDCNSPLACKFATCHQQCAQSRECPTGQQCVAAEDGKGVCQTPAEAPCGANGKACNSPLVCVNNACVNACISGPCPLATQTCIGGTYCLDTQVAGNDGSVGAGVGGACILNSDCASSLLCKFGSCRPACTSSLDCANGGRCVTVDGVAVCQMQEEAGCGPANPCALPLVCRTVDNTCRNACTSSGYCLSGQTCVGTVCVDNAELAGNDGSVGAGDGAAGSDADSAGVADGAVDHLAGDSTEPDGDGGATAPLTNGFTWRECEIYTATICGTWAWNPATGQFDANWTNGAQAFITLVENDSKIVLQRTDPAGTSAGLTAIYTGTRNGTSSISGTVVWTENGRPRSGTWTANW